MTMTTDGDQFDDIPSPTAPQPFVYLANNVVELLETAKRELERNHEAAKNSLSTASSILQLEIECRSRAKGDARPGALAGACALSSARISTALSTSGTS